MTETELREIDAEVHEKVMGQRVLVKTRLGVAASFYQDDPARNPVPYYSTNIAAAWGVVDRLTREEYVKVRCSSSCYHGDYCTIIAADDSQRDDTSLVKRDAVAVWGQTMSEAICRAALKAVAT